MKGRGSKNFAYPYARFLSYPAPRLKNPASAPETRNLVPLMSAENADIFRSTVTQSLLCFATVILTDTSRLEDFFYHNFFLYVELNCAIFDCFIFYHLFGITTSALLLKIGIEIFSDQHLTICLCYARKDEVGHAGELEQCTLVSTIACTVRIDQSASRMTMAITNTEYDKVTPS